MEKMTGWGIFLIIFGLGSFILPMIGWQFKLFMIFGLLLGAYAWIAAVLCVIAGATMLAMQLHKI